MEIALLIFAVLLILAGSVFVFVPAVPGTLIAWAGPAIYFLFSKEPLPSFSTAAIVVSGVLAAGTVAFDFLASLWGAKRYGATWRGGLGALLGAIVGPIALSPLGGFLGALLGLLVGPLVGAFLGEIVGGNGWQKSARAGWGTLIGALAALWVKLLFCMGLLVWMVAAFVFSAVENCG